MAKTIKRENLEIHLSVGVSEEAALCVHQEIASNHDPVYVDPGDVFLKDAGDACHASGAEGDDREYIAGEARPVSHPVPQDDRHWAGW